MPERSIRPLRVYLSGPMSPHPELGIELKPATVTQNFLQAERDLRSEYRRAIAEGGVTGKWAEDWPINIYNPARQFSLCYKLPRAKYFKRDLRVLLNTDIMVIIDSFTPEQIAASKGVQVERLICEQIDVPVFMLSEIEGVFR